MNWGKWFDIFVKIVVENMTAFLDKNSVFFKNNFNKYVNLNILQIAKNLSVSIMVKFFMLFLKTFEPIFHFPCIHWAWLPFPTGLILDDYWRPNLSGCWVFFAICDFSLNKSWKTYLGTRLPPGSRNWQLISPYSLIETIDMKEYI